MSASDIIEEIQTTLGVDDSDAEPQHLTSSLISNNDTSFGIFFYEHYVEDIDITDVWQAISEECRFWRFLLYEFLRRAWRGDQKERTG